LVLIAIGIGVGGWLWYTRVPQAADMPTEEVPMSQQDAPTRETASTSIAAGYTVQTYDCQHNVTLGTFVQITDPSTLGVELSKDGVIELRNTLPIQHDDEGDLYEGFGATVRMQGTDVVVEYDAHTYTCTPAPPTEPPEGVQSVL
jgi:hypothetical protein